jgi:FixJ family two-component response regulator
MDAATKDTILVVDDNADLRKALSLRLRAGAVGFFQKPVEDGPLLLAIWKALDMPRDRVPVNV